MKNARKRRRPANDLHPFPIRREACVVVPCKSWSGKKRATIALSFFVALMMGILLASLPKPTMNRIMVPTRQEPFDIVLSTNAPIPQDALDDEANSSFPKNTLKPAFEVTVEEDAQDHMTMAQDLLRQGEIMQAIKYQHRAVQQNPTNMYYRLKLAIMHDRLADKRGASLLYRQVVQAYDNHDKTLPKKLDIESIRRRLAYLDPTAAQ